MDNTCICCGTLIPEGRQICYVCQVKTEMDFDEKQKKAQERRAEKIAAIRISKPTDPQRREYANFDDLFE